ncbi:MULTISPECIES: LPXTG cell wall anchor domain-containing protein [Staphylococcus]|uniref:Gram-positive cocci surface proteins LPxTG domain-containing protein n=3 Tax=Bacteria TaxID=2 RepID=A0AB34ALN1_STAUR|nr:MULTISPECIES: LPXTG cell wall anchor domain-containing protein [Staphylococcus]KKI62577.1 hypothetical protein UF66_2235 [Staphylococcus cohnii subsp. cohnii]MDK7754218.1 LPXTG cell wall anchor domain-containing protein [Staphylococcus sp. UMB10092B]PNZ42994.1 hypothetical protein CD150_08100 [Staphylococcus ureilyticus]QKU19965.1 LPXTG cell wall anchor domain-containing protein [Staphylococcus cohnii]GEQ04172.1 hypothetical protein SCO02_26130 [Staphylococcus ureilyticus]
MKKLGILGTTTLAGALLFTGVNSNADAAEFSKSDAQNSVQNFVEGNPNYNLDPSSQFIDNTESDQPVSNAYKIGFGETQNQSPTWLYVKKDTGEIVDANGNVIQAANSNQTSEQQTTQGERPYGGVTPDGMTNEEYAELEQNVPNPNEVSTEEYNQAVESETARIQNESEQTSENTNASQSEVSELPETGSEEKNSTAITTMIATILLAAGSLLTFKRFSKNNK